MASDGGGKVKQKRNQTPSKPYERQSTLLGKLKDSVKDLLIPSWLSGTPGKDKKADEKATAQHTCEEVRPSARTGQLITDWTHGNAFQADNRTAPHMSGPGYGNSTSGKLPSSNIPGFGFQPPNGDLRSDQPTSLAMSTPSLNFNLGSQVQQLVAPNVTAGGVALTRNSDSVVGADSYQRYHEPVVSHPQDFGATPIRPIMVSTGVKSSSVKPDVKRQRLWSPEPLRQGRPLVPPPRGKPTFNSLLFGTPSKADTSTMANSFGDSSFYVGKTCYGGASSASRKSTMNTSLPYQSSLPLRKQVKATKMNSSFHATTSSTAQRILDTLERMSTPLEDAKKIPQGDPGNDSILSFTPSSYRRQSSRCSVTPITRPLQIPNRGPPTGQLQSTPKVQIARNRDKSMPMRQDSDQTLTITQEAVTAKESVNNISSQLASGSCKMKTKKFSQHISGQQEEEVMVVPNLRTEFTLPLSSMAPIVLSSGSERPVINQTSHSAVSTKPCSGAAPPKFTFATPIEEKNHSQGSLFGQQADQGFKFSSPIHVSPGKASAAGAEGGSKSSPEPAVGAATPQVSMWAPQMMKPKAMSPDIGGTSSSFKSYTKWNGNQKSDVVSPSIGLPVPTSLKKGSVMDILGKNSNNFDIGKCQDNTPLSAMFKKPAGSWECDTCMIQNKADTNRCAACSALKPGSKQSNTVATSGHGHGGSNVPLSDLFKKPEGTWDCSVCMIQNPPSSAKCAACETPKPGASSGPVPANSSVPLSMLFKKPEGSWDCDTCMIQNKSSSAKCVACETPKPGAKAAPMKVDNSLAAMFKKPEGSWECDTCMVQNSSTALRCIACDASKPGLQSAGIVSKPPPASESLIVINSGGGFSLKQPSANDTTTTTTGSAGFKFSNSSASVISSTPLSTSGFSFGNNNSQKDNGGFSVNNNSISSTAKTMSLGGGFQLSSLNSSPSSNSVVNSSSLGGFQLGAPTASSTSATVVSTSSNASIPSGGFQFGAPALTSSTSSSASSAIAGFTSSAQTSVSQPASGFQFGATSSINTSSKAGFTFNNANDSSLKTGASLAQIASSSSSSTPTTLAPKTDTTNNKTASIGGFQFLTSSASSSSGPSASAAPVENKSVNNSAQSQASFTFGAATSTDSQTGNSSPFLFGPPVSSAQSNAVGLGMGQSLATQSTSLVNGAFGAAHDKTNSLQGFDASSGGFSFGSKQNSIGKRSIAGAEHDGPSAKTAPAFGSVTKEPAVNGGFNFNANAGSFAFGSSQPAQPATGAFQFSANPSGPAPAATAFAFTAKPAQAVQPAKPNDVSFSSTPNFNFAAAQSDAVFQFGSKPAPKQPSSNLFTFGGAASNPTPSQPSAPVFGAATAAAAAPAAVGAFNIGAADTGQRKMKKAVRRIKPR